MQWTEGLGAERTELLPTVSKLSQSLGQQSLSFSNNELPATNCLFVPPSILRLSESQSSQQNTLKLPKRLQSMRPLLSRPLGDCVGRVTQPSAT